MVQKFTLRGLHELSKNVVYKSENFQFLKAQPFQLEMVILTTKYHTNQKIMPKSVKTYISMKLKVLESSFLFVISTKIWQ